MGDEGVKVRKLIRDTERRMCGRGQEVDEEGE